jgi:hypothetical protein
MHKQALLSVRGRGGHRYTTTGGNLNPESRRNGMSSGHASRSNATLKIVRSRHCIRNRIPCVVHARHSLSSRTRNQPCITPASPASATASAHFHRSSRIHRCGVFRAKRSQATVVRDAFRFHFTKNKKQCYYCRDWRTKLKIFSAGFNSFSDTETPSIKEEPM